MPTYKIQVMRFEPNKHFTLEPIEGYPISLLELPNIQLFIHHPYSENNGVTQDCWNISEVKSGLALVQWCKGTKEQTIEALKTNLLNTKVPDIQAHVQTLINNHVTQYGIANA